MTEATINRIRKFITDRDWGQYHSPANLAKSISIEANELLECFQWSDTEYDLQHVKEELADVMVYCRDLLDVLGLDEDEIINMKMDMNEKKYPVDKARGSSKKYTELKLKQFFFLEALCRVNLAGLQPEYRFRRRLFQTRKNLHGKNCRLY